MGREDAIKYGIEWLKDEYLDAKDRAFIKIALEALEQKPCEQIKWERDTAIAQLKELGYGFCEKLKPKDDVLDKIRTEIEEEYDNCDICEWYEDYDYEENDISEFQRVGSVSDILEIIDKYKAESEE